MASPAQRRTKDLVEALECALGPDDEAAKVASGCQLHCPSISQHQSLLIAAQPDEKTLLQHPV